MGEMADYLIDQAQDGYCAEDDFPIDAAARVRDMIRAGGFKLPDGRRSWNGVPLRAIEAVRHESYMDRVFDNPRMLSEHPEDFDTSGRGLDQYGSIYYP